MKKLLAILLSVLMLCTMIPFATVSAADEFNLELVVEDTTLKAGDEFQVTVNLNNIPNPGLIIATAEILFDSEAFELVTYFDEEYEMWFIGEIGEKYDAGDYGYLTFSPIDEETGAANRCYVNYTRAKATAAQAIKAAYPHFYTATFKVKDDAKPGTYTLTADKYQGGNTVLRGNVSVGNDLTVYNATVTIEGDEPAACTHEYDNACDVDCNLCYETREVEHTVKHVDAVAATCSTEGNMEYWYCEVCGAAWLDAECTRNTNLMSVKLPASCSYTAIHNEAIPAGCHYTGRIENWYCANCDVYYTDAACAMITNYLSLTVPALKDTADHVAAKAPTCYEPGNIEYWYCADCEQVWTDAALTQLTNAKNVILPITHNLKHVAAVAATCTTDGNIEYWYCADCGQAWLDEYCHLNTNLMSVKLPASCSYGAVHTAAKAPTCFEPGNIEYWYCANCDVYYADAACAIVTNAKNVILPITHNIVHVDAVAATCTTDGNIEYWYCADCGFAWLDEYCHLNTNLRAVVLPSLGGHVYDKDDITCNNCGELKEGADAADYKIVTFGGSSAAEAENNLSALAFLFNVNVDGMAVNAEIEANLANYDAANIKLELNGQEYKLTSMGALVSNNGQVPSSMADLSANVIDIYAKRLYKLSDCSASYAVRIVNIPENAYAAEIIAVPYICYENAEGEVETLVLTADAQSNSVNNVLGN